MVNPQVDELSMMTYLSQFPEAKLKAGAPFKGLHQKIMPNSPAHMRAATPTMSPRASPKRVKISSNFTDRGPPDASKCVIKGVETPRKFTVDCKNAGGEGLLEVGVIGPMTPCEYVSVRHRGNFIFEVSYDVCERGQSTVCVLWHGEHIPGSPFNIVV